MSILDLPDELILPIAHDITRLSDLNALVQTSRRFYRLFNLDLYRQDAQSHRMRYAKVFRQGSSHETKPSQENVNVKGFLAEAALDGVEVRHYICADQSLIPNAACLALRWGHDKVLFLLTKHGLSMEYPLDDGMTLLDMAVNYSRGSVIRMLIDMGVNPDQPHLGGHRQNNAFTPLYLALWLGHVEVAIILLEKGATVGKLSVLKELREGLIAHRGRLLGPKIISERLEICELLLGYSAEPGTLDASQRSPDKCHTD